MKRVNLEEFEDRAAEFDRAAEAAPGISAYCSSSDWILAAHRHLHPSRETFIREEEGHWIILARGRLCGMDGVLQPLDAGWCFSCPLIGPDRARLTDMLARLLREEGMRGPVWFLSGLPNEALFLAGLRQRLGRERRLYFLPGSDCALARLDDGLDNYLARRNAKFRANLKAARAKIRDKNLAFEWLPKPENAGAVYRRVLGVERRSWKHLRGESVFQNPGCDSFYLELMKRAARRGRLRALFARAEGADAAYVIGGRIGSVYRGFQMGYDQAWRSHGLGNLAQIEIMRRLAEEGCSLYDMGMIISYKRRWTDGFLRLANLLAGE